MLWDGLSLVNCSFLYLSVNTRRTSTGRGHTSPKLAAHSPAVRRNKRGETPLHVAAIKVCPRAFLLPIFKCDTTRMWWEEGIGRGMVLSLINQVMALSMIQYTWHRVYCNLTLVTKSSFMIHLDISRVYLMFLNWCCEVVKLMNDSLSQHNGDGFGNAIKHTCSTWFYVWFLLKNFTCLRIFIKHLKDYVMAFPNPSKAFNT